MEKTTMRPSELPETLQAAPALQPLGAEDLAQVEGGVLTSRALLAGMEPISPEGGYTGHSPSAYDHF